MKDIADVNKSLLDQVEAFFVSYNQQRGRNFKVTGTGGPKKAIRFVLAGMDAHREKRRKTDTEAFEVIVNIAVRRKFRAKYRVWTHCRPATADRGCR